MGIKRLAKEKIIIHSLKKKIKNQPFDPNFSEEYTLPEDADESKNNSYYFSGHSISGESLLIRQARRGKNSAEIWFLYQDRDGNSYSNVIEHYANLQDMPTTISCLEVEKLWSVSFIGKVKKHKKDSLIISNQIGEELNVEFTGIFTATRKIFEFSRHMAPLPVARALSKEKWNKDFKESVRENHQVHYEQQGELSGILILDSEEKQIKLNAMRDHSYGKRDWNYMDRHIWLMALLENGESFNVNMVRYPALSHLQTGYYESNIGTVCVNEVTSMDDITADGYVPLKFTYTAVLVDGRKFEIEAEKENEVKFSFDNGNYVICEGLGHFKINGMKARGILEFGFNKDKSRWNR